MLQWPGAAERGADIDDLVSDGSTRAKKPQGAETPIRLEAGSLDGGFDVQLEASAKSGRQPDDVATCRGLRTTAGSVRLDLSKLRRSWAQAAG